MYLFLLYLSLLINYVLKLSHQQFHYFRAWTSHHIMAGQQPTNHRCFTLNIFNIFQDGVFLHADEPGISGGYLKFLHVPFGNWWKLSASSFIISLRFITACDSSQTPCFHSPSLRHLHHLDEGCPSSLALSKDLLMNVVKGGEPSSKISKIMCCAGLFSDNLIILPNRRRDLAHHKVWELLYFLKEMGFDIFEGLVKIYCLEWKMFNSEWWEVFLMDASFVNVWNGSLWLDFRKYTVSFQHNLLL